jgi:predicted transcriptional regulator
MNYLKPKRDRAYTSFMSLMSVMAEKDLLKQEQQGKAFIYSANISQAKTRSRMLKDLMDRAFDGSASALVTHLFEQDQPDKEELREIRQSIEDFSKKKGRKK